MVVWLEAHPALEDLARARHVAQHLLHVHILVPAPPQASGPAWSQLADDAALLMVMWDSGFRIWGSWRMLLSATTDFLQAVGLALTDPVASKPHICSRSTLPDTHNPACWQRGRPQPEWAQTRQDRAIHRPACTRCMLVGPWATQQTEHMQAWLRCGAGPGCSHHGGPEVHRGERNKQTFRQAGGAAQGGDQP